MGSVSDNEDDDFVKDLGDVLGSEAGDDFGDDFEDDLPKTDEEAPPAKRLKVISTPKRLQKTDSKFLFGSARSWLIPDPTDFYPHESSPIVQPDDDDDDEDPLNAASPPNRGGKTVKKGKTGPAILPTIARNKIVSRLAHRRTPSTTLSRSSSRTPSSPSSM